MAITSRTTPEAQSQERASQPPTQPQQSRPFTPPSLDLPKGGGAIRGMGEKFAANPVTGTGSMSVPIATSPGRSSFDPQLSLSYDSGAGNGPFGFGWNLSLPTITRKTDKGLPRYDDAVESDVFLLSGAEDLVPLLVQNATGNWEAQKLPARTVDGQRYNIKRYRPRIEGLFARIERWTRDDGDVHWRSLSGDNVLTLYGKDANARIADPADPTRVFSWLICETRDDKGNAIVYEYKGEDSVDLDVSQAHERNRWDGANGSTANRYLKHVYYGNRTPLLDEEGRRPPFLSKNRIDGANWMFEVVLDYGEHDTDVPKPANNGIWPRRNDPFSSYRSGFEVRTYRLCQRVLMFHHFPGEEGVGDDCLVRSTDFTYSHEEAPDTARDPVYSFLLNVAHTGYRRRDGGYEARSLPPLAFAYTQPIVRDVVEEVDAASLENLPSGLSGGYQWTDLHGEGLPGILTEQGGAWFYKRNLSPLTVAPGEGADGTEARFAAIERVATMPNLALHGGAQFMDLAGDGRPDLVVLNGPMAGLYEHDEAESWEPFQPFTSRLSRDMHDPNLKFIDLDGDGHADVLISENDAFVWHPSLAEAGFGPALRVAQALDEEKGPRLVFADGEQAVYLADLSGDGLTDLVRVRNGEVCYWPNLGYGCFGARVTMDDAPWFDNPDQFEQRRIRLADIDGSGTTDIMYLHRDGVHLYFNQSGNAWGAMHALAVFPHVDNLTDVTVADLLGNSTACLVWSSALPGHTRQAMRYVNLMGDKKPHLLIRTVNNLGAETRVHYAPSTKFYLQDRQDGNPWMTKLPFPVHVVERVETFDHVSRNRFVTRYRYHHGHFDGTEREFRGFGMVEQLDTESLAALSQSNDFPIGDNINVATHAPPVLTRTWFHTGQHLDREHVSDFFAGLLNGSEQTQYYREPGLDNEQARTLLLPDTMLPEGLSPEEEREACRSMKGAMLRQEVYALDGTAKAEHPYAVTEQNFTIRSVQPRGDNAFAVFFTNPREAISYHYERNPTDPRVQHALTLEVGEFGDVLKAAAIGYGRRRDAPEADLLPEDREKQRLVHITCIENTFTTPILDLPDDYRAPLPAEARTYELRKPEQERSANGLTKLYAFNEVLSRVIKAADGSHDVAYEDVLFESARQAAANSPQEGERTFRRLIEQVRILYRPDDLGGSRNDALALLVQGTMEVLALPGESYKLAFTPGLLEQVYRRPLNSVQEPGSPPPENLLPDPAALLPVNGPGGDASGRGGYVDLDDDGQWWVPSGRTFFSPGPGDTPAEELAFAREHFFLPHSYRDPFHTTTTGTASTVGYDAHNLFMQETRDPLGNTTLARYDYRVLASRAMTDPNGNRTEVAFDTLGMVAGTAVMGKEDEPDGVPKGDSLANFAPDPTVAELAAFIAQPRQPSGNAEESEASTVTRDLLGNATTRIVYDLDRFHRLGEPPFAATIRREKHVGDLDDGEQSPLQIGFSYSDGFGREIQKKLQAEAGQVPLRDANGKILLGPDGQPEMTANAVRPRWVGSGWTVFNNKGNPVRQYEPFFTDTHHVEFDTRIGVSPVLFYDPAGRAVATLRPDHTWEKVLFDPWRQTTHDLNDTVLLDPRADEDIRGFLVNPDGSARIPEAEYLPTWHALRTDPTHAAAFAARYPDDADRANETRAAAKAAAHADTSLSAYVDTLGRPFLTVAQNRVVCQDHDLDGSEENISSRVELDIEGNQRTVRDAIEQSGDPLGRVVMRYDYDMLGNIIHQASMEAGERWMLNDVSGKPIRAWNSRGHESRNEYDPLRRLLRAFVSGTDPGDPAREILTDRMVYGEQHPEAETRNLRGMAFLALDQSGAAMTELYDFKGNPLAASRRLALEYRRSLDWRTVDGTLPGVGTMVDPGALDAALAPLLEADTYASRTTFDAFNRPILLTTPHTPFIHPNVIRPGYNEANLLERVDANVRGEQVNGEPTFTPFVVNIDYDAKGQRTLVDYANGVRSRYRYDPFTFRLRHLLTRRDAARFPDDCPDSPPAGSPGCQVQNLHYTYDPAGNVTHIRDEAQQRVFFRNLRVEPSNDYTYDAIYRLIEARGREHLGQSGDQRNPPTPPGAFNGFHVGQEHPNEQAAMGVYIERYVYDAVGNFLSMQHRGIDPLHPGWTREYHYAAPSLLEMGKRSNRLSSTTLGTQNGAGLVEHYAYDAHGNITSMPHLPLIEWDYRGQLQATSRQVVTNGGTPEITYYVYDSAGQRTRKVTERQAASGQTSTRREERVYLGAGFDIYREYEGDGDTVKLERATLHIMDDQRRVALVETRTRGDDASLPQLTRFQLGNHLGSASLELDDEARIISYEEYYPYGSTSYQAGRSNTETPKRYRYSGMERDEESGLAFHSARYYAPWLGLWTAPDPAGLVDGPALYVFARNNPVNLRDVSGMDSVGTLVEYSKGLGKGNKVHQLHFFPESIQKKLNPDWSRALSRQHKELVYVGSAKLNAAADAKIRAYASRIDRVRDEKHLLKIIHDIKDIWVEAGVPRDIVNKWSYSAYSTARKIGILKKLPPPRPTVLRRTPDGDVSDATKGGSGRLGKAGKVVKVLAVIEGVSVAGDALAHVFKGEFGKAAGVVTSFAYDQTIGTVVDAVGVVGDVADFVTDPFAGIKDSLDTLKQMQDEQDAFLADYFGWNDKPADTPPPAPAPVIVPRPAPKKVDRGNAAQGLMLLAYAIALAAQAPPNPPAQEETSTTEDTIGTSSSVPLVWVQDFRCPLWTPTGIPFGNPPCWVPAY